MWIQRHFKDTLHPLFILAVLASLEPVECMAPSAASLASMGSKLLQTVESWMQAWAAEEVGQSEYTNFRDNLRYFSEDSVPDWSIELPLVAKNIEAYLQKSIDASVSMSQAAEIYAQAEIDVTDQVDTQSYVWYNNSYFQVESDGTISNSVYNARFEYAVNDTVSSVKLPADLWSQKKPVLRDIVWTEGLTQNFRDNADRMSGDLYWQYFVTPEGITRIYPGAQINTKNIFDSRFESWYVEASTLPKLIVIAIDSSGSSDGQVNTFIDVTLSYVLNTLTDNDYVNVVYFKNDLVSMIASAEQLANAGIEDCNVTNSPVNFIRASKSNIQKIKTAQQLHSNYNSTADFALLFTKLDQLFSRGEEEISTYCTKILLLLTDGGKGSLVDNGANALANLAQNHPDMRLLIAIEGQDVYNSENDGVHMLACEYNGYYLPITSTEAIRERLVDFIGILSIPYIMNNVSKITWSNPRCNSWSKNVGLVVTVSIPALNATPGSQALLGVAATDIPLAWLDQFIPWSKLGVGTDVYMINGKGAVSYLEDMNSLLPIAENVAFVPEIDYFELVSDGLQFKQMIMDTTIEDNIKIIPYLDRYVSRDKIHHMLKFSTGNIMIAKIANAPFTLAFDIPSLYSVYMKPESSQLVSVLPTVKSILRNGFSSIAESSLKRGFYVDPRPYCQPLQSNVALMSSQGIIDRILTEDLSGCGDLFYQLMIGTLLSESWQSAVGKVTEFSDIITNSFLYTSAGTLVTYNINNDDILTSKLVHRYQSVTESIMTTADYTYTFFNQYSSIFEGDLNCFRWHGATAKANGNRVNYPIFVAKPLSNEGDTLRFGFVGISVNHKSFRDTWLGFAGEACTSETTTRSCYILDHGGFLLSTNLIDPSISDSDAYQLGASFADIDPCMMSDLVQKGIYKTQTVITSPCQCMTETGEGSSASRMRSFVWFFLSTLYNFLIKLTSVGTYSWLLELTYFPVNFLWASGDDTSDESSDYQWIRDYKRCEYQTTLYYYGNEQTVDQGVQVECAKNCSCTAGRSYSAQRIADTNLLIVVVEESLPIDTLGSVASECVKCGGSQRVSLIPEVVKIADNPGSSVSDSGAPVEEYKVNTCNYRPKYTTQSQWDTCVRTHEWELPYKTCAGTKSSMPQGLAVATIALMAIIINMQWS